MTNMNSGFPEDVVISILLKDSPEFRTFYSIERKKIPWPIIWLQDNSLPEGINYRATRYETGERAIRLRRIPAILQDATKIAHEIEHFVLDSEGYPLLAGKTLEHENITSAISSMIADVMVNKKLMEYGFDLRSDCIEEENESRRQLDKIASAPDNRLSRIWWMSNYVSNLLDRHLIFGDNDNNEFKIWFTSKYPDIASRGDKLLQMINRTGYDTPEKQRKLFREIIRRYDLEDVVLSPEKIG